MSDAAARQQQELQAEGNVVSACSISRRPWCSARSTRCRARWWSVSLRDGARADHDGGGAAVRGILVRQRSIASVLLAVTAWLGAHQGGVNARIADALYSLLCGWAVILIFGLRGPRPGERGYDPSAGART